MMVLEQPLSNLDALWDKEGWNNDIMDEWLSDSSITEEE